VIQQIEGLAANVEKRCLIPQTEALVQAEVQLVEGVITQGVASGVSIRMAGVGRNALRDIACLCQQRAEVFRTCEILRIALLHGAEAADVVVSSTQGLWIARARGGKGSYLRDGRVHDIGTVVGEQVFSAFTIELIETDAVSRPDDRLRSELVCETKTRRKVQLWRVANARLKIPPLAA
jgi:hypothetical protein